MTCAQDVLAKQTVLSCLIQSDLESVNSNRILSSYVYITLMSAYSVGSYCHSLDNSVGVTLEDRSVHECAGVALVCVTSNVLYIAGSILCEHPLSAGGEACTAASSDTGIENFLNYLIGSHGGQCLIQCLITVGSDILLDILGVDNAAVSQSDSLLLSVEVCLIQRYDGTVLVNSLLIQQILADLTVHEMLVNDPLDALGSSLCIESTLRVNDNNGSE